MHNAPQPTARQRMRFWLTTAIGAVLSTPSIERRRRKACNGSRSWRRSHNALIKTPSVAEWTSARWPIILLGACLLCLVATCPQDVGAADPKQTGEADLWGRVDPGLRDVRWQLLPKRIAHVAVSPDQRVWTVLGNSSQSPVQSVAETKQLVEREFSKPSPQLHGIKRLFFEAETFAGDGKNKLRRVWVVSRQASGGPNILLGYDGKRWTDPQEFDANSYDATSFSFARMIQLNDAVVFVNARGAHVFREDKWTLQDLLPSEGKGRGDNTINRLAVWIRDSGQETILSPQRPNTHTFGVRRSVWKLRDGKWTEVQLPEACRVEQSQCGLLEDAFIFVLNKYTITRVVDGKIVPGKNSFSMTRISADGEVTELDADEPLTIGRYQAKLTFSMGNDSTGRFYASCRDVKKGKKSLGAGLLVHTDGKARFFPAGKGLASRIRLDSIRPTGEGALAWARIRKPVIPGKPQGHWDKAALVDLQRMTIVEELPDPSFRVVCTEADGTVFASFGKRGSLAAFRPDAQEEREVLTSKPIPLFGYRGLAIAEDGSIWLAGREGRLQRFDGRRWDIPFDTVKMRHDLQEWMATHLMVPGNDGHMLCMAATAPRYAMQGWTHPRMYLFNGKQHQETEPLLIDTARSHPELLRKAFSGPRTMMPWFAQKPQMPTERSASTGKYENVEVRGAGVVITKQGDIWTNAFGRIRVAVGEERVDLTVPPSPEKRSSDPSAYVLNMTLMPGDEDVFLQLSDGRTFFAQLQGGEIDLTAGPKLADRGNWDARSPFAIRDREGGIWIIPAAEKKISRRSDYPQEGETVRRYVSPDKYEEFADIGIPILADDRGCVWFGDSYGSEMERITIRSPSGQTSTIKIPFRDLNTPIFAGGPGRVFVWTMAGLQAFLAADPTKPTEYVAGPVYHLKNPFGHKYSNRDVDFRYSSLGYIAIYEARGSRQDAKNAYLYRVGPIGESKRKAERPKRKARESESGRSPKLDSVSKLRTWTDRSGKFSIEAEFVGVKDGKVRLRKDNGAERSIAIKKLSEADRKFVRRMQARE